MKKTVVICGLVALAAIAGSAQSKYSVEWGEPIQIDGDETGVQRETLSGSTSYTVEYVLGRSTGRHAKAKLYDGSGKVIKEAKFTFKSVSKVFLGLGLRPELEQYLKLGSRRFFMLKELDTKTKHIYLRAWEFFPSTLTLADEPITLATVALLDGDLSTYHWMISPNRDRVYVLESPGKGLNPAAKLNVKTFDRELTLLSEREFPLTLETSHLQVRSFTLEHGHLVVSSRDYTRRPSIWRALPPYRVLYFIVPNGEQALRVVNLDLPGVQASDARHRFQGPDELVFYGLYAKSEVNLSSGAFFARYSIKQRRSDAPQVRAFPSHLVESGDYRTKGDKKKHPGELLNLRVADLRMRSDGGLQFIAEQTNSYWTSWSMDNFDGSMSTTYSGTWNQFQNIMVYTLYRDPARDWFSIIRKRQQSVGSDREYSFTHKYDRSGTLWMLYNDFPANLSLPPTKEPSALGVRESKMGTVLVSVDPRGNTQRELLFTKKAIGHAFAPKQTVFLPDGSAQLAAFAQKSYRLGVLRLPQ